MSSSITSTPARSGRTSLDEPISPRMQEKKELADLNDRLAAYIELVRSQKFGEGKLKEIVITIEETYKKEITEIKGLHESQLIRVRAQLDDSEKARTKVEIENQVLRDENASLKTKLSTSEKQLADKKWLLQASEAKLTQLRASLADTEGQIKHWENECSRLEKRLKDALDKLEEESVKRVAAENRLKKLREELAAVKQVHEKEMTALTKMRQTLFEKFDEQGSFDDYADDLKEMRKDWDERIRMYQEQTKKNYDRQVHEYQLEIRGLKDELNHWKIDYEELQEIRVKLDNEIASYRILLEGEEARLKRLQTPKKSSGKRTIGQSIGQVQTSKRIHTEDGVTNVSSSTGPMKISETDPEGQFIKITNVTEKEQTLGGWQLKHTADEDEDKQTCYKFHWNLHVKPGATVTVWSAEAEVTHSPPDVLVMKGLKWFSADNMKSVLINPQGEEMASREIKRSIGMAALVSDETHEEAEEIEEEEGEEGEYEEEEVVIGQQREIRRREFNTTGSWGWKFFSFLK